MAVDETRRTASTHVFVDAGVLDVDGVVALDSATEHHLSRVLRLRSGEHVTVSDGAGRWRETTVASAAGSGMSGFRLEPTSGIVTVPRPHPPLTIASAIPKGDRVDWLVQKAVEIGVDTLQLLHSDRSAIRWKPDRAAKQMVRLRRIAIEAARQSRRVELPTVLPPTAASAVLPTGAVAEPGGRAVGADDHVIVIGPEGGWSSAEREVAREQVTLGSNVLRTETAVLVAATLYVAHYH